MVCVCSNELELSWDPLEAYCREMCLANQTLFSKRPAFDDDVIAPAPPTSAAAAGVSGAEESERILWKESFVADSCVLEEGRGSQEAELSPIRSPFRENDDVIIVEGEFPQCVDDVPSLSLTSTAEPPVGYLKPHPFPRKRPGTTQALNPPPLPATSSSSFGASSGRDPWCIVQQAGARGDHYMGGAKGSRENLYGFSSPRRKKQKTACTCMWYDSIWYS